MASAYCEHCDRMFPHAKALFQHLLHSSINHPFCDLCQVSFASVYSLKRHKEEEHYYCYCRDCDRLFASPANLAAHRASSIHAQKSFVCPGRLCGRAFVSRSALILHAEGGTCRSGITRKIINARMAQVDSQNVITNPARMIGGGTGTEHEYWASERSWNGFGYQCILCDAQFRTLSSLNQHLKSPRHLQPMYHCPKRGCNLQFTVLSALCQHVEWSSCGARQTKVVQDAVRHLTRGMNAITL